jgi:alcohol dehydrogenase class IV
VQDWGTYGPTRIRFGWGRVNEVHRVGDELNGEKVFLVAGKGFPKRTDAFERIVQKLPDLPLGRFAEAEEHPSIETVDRGVGRSTAWNPRPMNEEDLLQICRAVL